MAEGIHWLEINWLVMGLSHHVSELSFKILLLVVMLDVSDWLNNEVSWLSVA